MADFNKAIPFTRKAEGGFVNDPADSGGFTYCGISKKNNPDFPGWLIIQGQMPLRYNQVIDNTQLNQMIAAYYKAEYWDEMNGDSIQSDKVAIAIFDWYVNAKHNAIKRVQALLHNNAPDGWCGPGTVKQINEQDSDVFFKEIQQARKDYYNKIASSNPSQKKFLQGWIDRVDNLTYFI